MTRSFITFCKKFYYFLQGALLASLVQEVLAVQRVALGWAEAGVADDAAQLFFGGAVGYACGSYYIFFEHYRAYVVAAEAQAHLADFQALRDPTGLHVEEVREIEARDGQCLQILDRGGFVPVAAAERGVVRLKAPRDEGGEATGFFLQIVDLLEVVDTVFVVLADTEHHGRGGAHADLVGGSMDVDPIIREAFQAGDFVADFVVENLSATARDGIEASIAQAQNRIANAEAAVLGDGDDLGSGVAVQMNLGKTLLDSAEHLFVPVDFQIGMQAALHQHTGAAEFDGLANLFVDGVEIEDVAFLCRWAFEWAIEGAEGAVLGAEVGVIDVAVDDIGDRAFGMEPAAHRIGFHADADQVIGLEHLQSLLLGQGHVLLNSSREDDWHQNGRLRVRVGLRAWPVEREILRYA
jgi:hypothetical protein